MEHTSKIQLTDFYYIPQQLYKFKFDSCCRKKLPRKWPGI